jgi:hypothetical protein
VEWLPTDCWRSGIFLNNLAKTDTHGDFRDAEQGSHFLYCFFSVATCAMHSTHFAIVLTAVTLVGTVVLTTVDRNFMPGVELVPRARIPGLGTIPGGTGTFDGIQKGLARCMDELCRWDGPAGIRQVRYRHRR